VKIKLDENLSRHLKPLLEKLEHDVCTVLDENLLSQPDTRIGAAAKAEGRILFTLDLEFGDLRKYPPGGHHGVILFRPYSMGPLGVNQFIAGFVAQVDLLDFSGCVVIVEPDKVRVRRPPPNNTP